jgi:hypothetical protein
MFSVIFCEPFPIQLLMVCCLLFSGMPITHRGTRSRSSNSSVARQDTVSSENAPDDIEAEDQQVGDFYLRGGADLPPIIHNEQSRPLIEPEGNS